MAYEFSSGGTVVTDKPIYLNKAVTYGGQSLYLGRIAALPAQSVVGTASATYGLWSAVTQGGQRKKVIVSGLPGSSAEVLWDLQSGRLYSTISRTVYARFFKYCDLMNEGRIFQIQIPFMLSGTAGDVTFQNCPWDIKFGEYSIGIDGNRATGTLSLGLYKVAGGTGTHATLTLGATAGVSTDGFKAIAGGIEFDTSNKIVIRNGGGVNSGFSFMTIALREILE